MLKFLIVFILIFEAAFAARLTLDDRRKKILGIIDEELSEVVRLARQQDNKNPDTLLRLSELNLEKARLYREAENEQFLSIPPEERRNVKRSEFFSTSSNIFNKANESALVVVRKFPKYKGLPDVYYILAYNYKELGEHEEAQKYFKLASKGDKGGSSEIGLKSKLNLADYYFNAHKYKEAIPLYEASINKLNEKWWTKDSFNLAWCYYRTMRYDKAINLMKEVHRKSGDKKYIDMRSNVERDIGIFYVDAGKVQEAINFYEGLGINYTEQFVKIANSIVTQGRFAQAESLLEQAEKLEKNRERRIDILIAQLNLFDKYNKIEQHLKVSKELVQMNTESPLNNDHLQKLNYHVNKKAAELQKTTASDIYKSVPKVQKKKSSQAIEYFNLAAILSPSQKAEKTFYQAETAYAANDFSKALKLYLTAFDDAKKSNDKKVMSQSLEGMLSALAQPSVEGKIADSYYIPVYSRYISFDSKSEKANQIYVKLFNAQFDAKKIPDAEETMASFAKNFPKDFKTQEGMLAKIMDYYKDKKDYGPVKSYVNRINSGEFKVSAKYAEALRSLMTKIQIEGVQQSLAKGEKAVALQGYQQIYDSAESTPKAKNNAAYNLSALYFEMGDTNQAYQWAVTALKDMEIDDIMKLADSFLSMASGLFLRHSFNQSADLSYRILGKLCKQNSSNKIVAYKNAAFIFLANNDIEKALEVKNAGKSCSIPDATITEVSFEILKDLAKAKRWEVYEEITKELEANQKNHALLIKPLEELRVQYIGIGNTDEAKAIADKQNRFYNSAKAQKVDIPVEGLDLISNRMLASVIEKKKRLDDIQLAFPEANFNAAVRSKLQILDQMAGDINQIQRVGSGKGIVEAYQYVIKAYESFGLALKNFTPAGKEQAYLDSFRKAMADVHGPILQNAVKQRNEIRKLIMDNKILATSNFSVLFPESEEFKRYYTEKEAVLMERGGRR